MDEKFFIRYFENYATGYDTFDGERLARFYFSPTHLVKNGSVVSLFTTAEITEHLKSLLVSYKEHGYKKGNVIGVEVKPMGAWSVAVTVHWIIDHVSGSILRDFHSTYNLFKQGEDWKILVTTNHDR